MSAAAAPTARGASAAAVTGGTTATVTTTATTAAAPRMEIILRKPRDGDAAAGSGSERQGAAPQRPRIRWAAGTVDNEHLGRKSSKKCCIYHKPRAFGESSDESDFEDGEEGHHHHHHHHDDHHHHDGDGGCSGHHHGSGNIYAGGPQ
eukprot:CAMPEP_0182920036 /NCGR_PEP_ID=MMETSP0105_2-20130417/3168_1 /TAXON_ID=81532 ORGANISM="Acanthoeca-like sp., Strain 10tr" /NCGR_SAMPLE_ID=MMETSP0105_2 /ASSEMBLY_ACC=CAM_ASM_000205 /LENGTH=147 /DNA_ID=CAMNT_0025057355 /DNA_START=284 /DNA_END=727 /DNA_ORIENTATION=+